MESTEQINKILAEVSANMDKTIDSLTKELAKIRSGRATTSMLDNIRVDYYGNQSPINQVGTISAVDAQLITISPWEKKMLPEIEKAILKANIGFNPQNDGNIIRIPIPPLTEEKRKQLVKIMHKTVEDYKNSVRNSRRDGNQKLKNMEKEKQLSKDDLERFTQKIQLLNDEHIKTIENITKEKEAELMAT